MREGIIVIILNLMEALGIHLTYCKLLQKRASFRPGRIMPVVICGIIIGLGYNFLDGYTVKLTVYLIGFLIVLKLSSFRWSKAFILYAISLFLLFFLQALTLVVTLLPIEEYHTMALFGNSLYLTLVILIYWKIPVGKLFQLTEQNLVIKFIFFILSAVFFITMLILDFNTDKVIHYIFHYIIAVLLSGWGIYETAIVMQKYTTEIPARYHEHDNLIAGLVSLYMTYGNDELRGEVSGFLEGFGRKEFADKLSVTLDNEKDFLTVFLTCKQGDALEKGIKVTWDIVYAENMRVSKTDMIKIIGILLDNAIEHCEKGQEVFLEIFVTDYIFDIEVKNPYKGSSEDVGRMFEKGSSSKERGPGGHGLNNLWKIVNKLDGKIMVQPFDGSITFKVVI